MVDFLYDIAFPESCVFSELKYGRWVTGCWGRGLSSLDQLEAAPYCVSRAGATTLVD